MDKIKICAVLGPTASGKTSLGVRLARKYNGEVVSCDSMQVYKGVPISTATPTTDEMQGIKHHLISFLDLDRDYSVAKYVEDAKKIIFDIYKRGKLPILVGGTGLYAFSLIDNISFSEQTDNSEVRKRLEEESKNSGNEVLLSRLKEIDFETAEKLHLKDTKRIIRALEIYELTGKTKTQLDIESRMNVSPFDPCIIGLNFSDREILYDRINKRVDAMVESGLIEEAKKIYDLNLPDCTMLQAIGIKEFIPFFEGKQSIEDAISQVKQSSRRYAKRQLTMLRKDERINWIYPDVERCRQNIFEKTCKILENNGSL